MNDKRIIEDALSSVVPLGDDLTPQAEELGQSVLEIVHRRPAPTAVQVAEAPDLSQFTTLELLMELTRRAIKEGT